MARRLKKVHVVPDYKAVGYEAFVRALYRALRGISEGHRGTVFTVAPGKLHHATATQMLIADVIRRVNLKADGRLIVMEKRGINRRTTFTLNRAFFLSLTEDQWVELAK